MLITDLPPTSDKEFWGDAFTYVTEKPAPKKLSLEDHYLKVLNGQVVCTSCPAQHTVSVDLDKFRIEEGRIVSLR